MYLFEQEQIEQIEGTLMGNSRGNDIPAIIVISFNPSR